MKKIKPLFSGIMWWMIGFLFIKPSLLLASSSGIIPQPPANQQLSSSNDFVGTIASLIVEVGPVAMTVFTGTGFVLGGICVWHGVKIMRRDAQAGLGVFGTWIGVGSVVIVFTVFLAYYVNQAFQALSSASVV